MKETDFPGGQVVKNSLCNAGDMGSSPGQGTKTPRAAEQLSGCAAMTEPAHQDSRVHEPQQKSSHDAMKLAKCCS